MDAYELYAVDINTDDSVTLFVDGVVAQGHDLNADMQRLYGDGGVDPRAIFMGKLEPEFRLTTPQLATCLATCGISGLKISAGVNGDGADMYWQKVEQGGTRASGSNHLKLTVGTGLMYPTAMTIRDDGAPAELPYVIAASWDGTNDPVSVTTGAALPGTAAASEAFTVGPVKMNGSTLDGVQSITIDPGIQIKKIKGDGHVYPDVVYIQQRQPEIRVDLADMAALDTVGVLAGTPQGATDSVIYLRKMAANGTRVADATEEHISFTIDDGNFRIDRADGREAGDQACTVIITPAYDGTAAIIAIDVAAAIS